MYADVADFKPQLAYSTEKINWNLVKLSLNFNGALTNFVLSSLV